MTKLLILSVSAGNGHVRAAQAVLVQVLAKLSRPGFTAATMEAHA